MPPLGQNALPKPILCLCFHFSWKHVAFTWHTRAKKGSAGKSNENIVVEERSIKAAEQDPSATIVANVCSTGATVVGSVNDNEFWQRRTQPPSFLLLLSRKMDLTIPQWSTLCPGSPMAYYNQFLWQYKTFVLVSFIGVMYSIGTNLKQKSVLMFW